MIEFKNRVVKIIFYVIFSLLTLLSVFVVYTAFAQPSSMMGLPYLIFFLVVFLLLPSLLMIRLFTNPTPHKTRADKQTRAGKWIPISTFLVLGVLATVLMTTLKGSRCEAVGPEAALWDCDFAGADLSNMDLHGSDMSHIDLSSADLSGSDLSGGDLSGADLSSSVLVGANISDAELSNAKLDGADLSDAILDGASLKLASLIGVTGLTDESLANLAEWDGMLLQSEEEIYAQLRQVCEGMSVESAAEYDPFQGATSILLITDEGERHPTTASVPGFWRPESASNTELVACFSEPSRVAWSTCTYDDGTSFDRYSQRIEISVFIARTGELLDMITLEGPSPRTCPEEIIAGSEPRDYLGDAPYGAQIIDALTLLMHEGGDLHPPRLP